MSSKANQTDRRPDESSQISGSQTVHRAISILEIFELDKPSWTLTEISNETGLTLSTTHRLIHSLQDHEFLIVDSESKRYSLGPGLMRLARVILDRDELQGIYELAAPIMSETRNRTGETVGLHRILGSYRVCISELASFHTVRTQTSVGGLQPLHAGAASKVLIAWLTDAARLQLLPDDAFAAVTPNSHTTRDSLELDLERVREQGYAVSLGESVNGAAALAVPIFDATGTAVAAVNVTGPVERWNLESMRDHVDELLAAASSVSRHLGYSGAIPPTRRHR